MESYERMKGEWDGAFSGFVSLAKAVEEIVAGGI